MATIYVSSTFTDLEECRRQVSVTVRRMHHTDVAMEYYGAQDARPLDKCLADVAACDIYICIVAWRYGFIPSGRSESITELEYRQAVASGKPCLVFLLSETAPWPQNRVEIGAYDRVLAFREELRHDRVVAEFTDCADLARKVGEAIYTAGLGTAGGKADWEAYRRAVFDTHRWVRLAVIAGAKQDRRFAEIPLTEVFVTQPVQAGPPDYDVPSPADSGPAAENPGEFASLAGFAGTMPSLEVLGRESRQVFLGAPGTGKSTLLLDATLLLCDTGRDPATLPAALRGAPVPFFVELRQYVLDKADGFVSYIASSATRQYGVEIDAESIQALLAAQDRALVFFDGLDEVFDPGTQSRVVEEFRAFARRYPGTRLVVTSRIAGYRALELERDGFRHYTLLGFGMPEIREFIPKWYRYYTWQGDTRDARELIRRISESPRLLELAQNPLLLTMMAVIYKHHDLPEKRWQLYHRCTEVLLEDWDVKRKNIARNVLLPLGFSMVADQKAELLQRVSMYMLERETAGSELNAIGRGPLLEILASYLRQEYGKPAGEAHAVASEILNHLRERTYVIAEIGDGLFGFVHRTFMEFFAAQHCKAEFNRREADYEWLTRDLFGTRWRRQEWREVLLLLIAMLKDQGSPVRKVIDHIRRERVQGSPVQLGFAARCLAEATTTDDEWSQSLLGELADEICNEAWQSGNAEARAFVEDALGSFAVLSSMVSLSQDGRRQVESLAGAPVLYRRMVGFQLQLALRAKEERLSFALDALKDSEEAVRRGAIAALEREWPGRQEVFAALTDVLRGDRQARVRSAALQALDRGWPPGPEILDALEDRAAVETAYTFITEVMRYLARRWSGNLRALDILLKLSDADLPVPRNYDLAWVRSQVRDAALAAIAEGWRHSADCGLVLHDHCRRASDQGALIVLSALARFGQEDAEAAAWARLSGRADSYERGTWLTALLRAGPDVPDLRSWALQRTAEDVDPAVRMGIISVLRPAQELAWLAERLARDPDAGVRLRALYAWAKAARPGERASVLRDRIAHDESGQMRAKALHLLAESDQALATEVFIRDHLHEEKYSVAKMSCLWSLTFIKTARSATIRWAALRSHINPMVWLSGDSEYSRNRVYSFLQMIADSHGISVKPEGYLNLARDFEFLLVAAEGDDPLVRCYAMLLLMTVATPEEGRALVSERAAVEKNREAKKIISGLMTRFPVDPAGSVG